MALIANLQYGWTLFVSPIHVARGWSQAEIQWAFSIFVATETWLTPPAGAIADRLGPRLGPALMIAAGGVLVGLGWVVNAYADSLALLYTGGALSGSIRVAPSRALAPGLSTPPAWATWSNGFPTDAAWLSG
jgi:OFA family oxalate/formate antiporter-like MFS transporter